MSTEKEKFERTKQALDAAKEEMLETERLIPSLGPDPRNKLEQQKAEMEAQITNGRGNFVVYARILSRLKEAQEAAAQRDKAFAKWRAQRKTVEDLEAELERLRPSFLREITRRV